MWKILENIDLEAILPREYSLPVSEDTPDHQGERSHWVRTSPGHSSQYTKQSKTELRMSLMQSLTF